MAFFVRIEVGPAGLSIEEAACDLTFVAQRLNLPVICNFNGIELSATPITSIKAVIKQFRDDIRFQQSVRDAVREAG